MPKIDIKAASFPLRVARNTQGLTLEVVSKELNITSMHLSRIEAGKSLPTREVARRLYDYYDAEIPMAAIYDPEWYMGVTPAPQEP